MNDNLSKKQRAQWIFMDAGDTFIYGYPTLYDAVQDCWKQCGAEIPLGSVKQAVSSFMKENPSAVCVSAALFEEYLKSMYRHVLAELRFPGELDQGVGYLWGEWTSGHRLRLFDDAKQSLHRLTEAGFRLGVITNWDSSIHSALKRLGVGDCFEHIIVSCEQGFAKPSPEIFLIALDKAGANADECWFLGDQARYDIEPAKALGMKTILVDYFGKNRDDKTADLYAPSMSAAALMVLNQSNSWKAL